MRGDTARVIPLDPDKRLGIKKLNVSILCIIVSGEVKAGSLVAVMGSRYGMNHSIVNYFFK